MGRRGWSPSLFNNPGSSPINLTLTTPPLHLTFSPLSQRLTRIEVFGVSPAAWVAYRGNRLSGDDPDDEDEDVMRTVRRIMGPTYGSSKMEGDTSEAGHAGEEMLSYPGVAFGVMRSDGGSTIGRIIVTPLPTPKGAPADQAWLYPVLPDNPPVAKGDLRLAEIQLASSRSPTVVRLNFHPSPDQLLPPVELKIGETTSEDILCELGSAIRTFWKEDDRLTIHTASVDSPKPSKDPALQPNSYFLSYPHLGLTLLVSSTSAPHTLEKVILHSNLPGEVQFGRTTRAVWVLARGEERVGVEDGWARLKPLLDGRVNGATRTPSSLSSGQASKEGRKGGVKEANVEDLLGFESAAASTVERGKVLEECGDPRPMVLDRTVGEGRGGVKGKPTEIHGFPSIAVEVTQSGNVETVWLF
ncbi:UPF0183 family protein [Rhodotorula toruloides]|uniref:UPF0183 family protein n=1 Tax=Rhodotorula toruloides TaxID=5286 RepID=A0A511KIS8_RHOTO|nr:UPF0183 family protein [Rhodotorula toruloides]